MKRGWAEQQVIMKSFWRFAFGGQIAGAWQSTISPGTCFHQFTNGAVSDHFTDAIEIFMFMALGANLRGKFVFVLEIGCSNHSRFFDAIGQRLFTINMLASIHGPICNEGMRVIGGAANHRFNIFLFETLSPIDILFSVWSFQLLGPKRQVLLINITKGHNVLSRKTAEVSFASSPGADQGNIQLVAGSLGAKELRLWKD